MLKRGTGRAEEGPFSFMVLASAAKKGNIGPEVVVRIVGERGWFPLEIAMSRRGVELSAAKSPAPSEPAEVVPAEDSGTSALTYLRIGIGTLLTSVGVLILIWVVAAGSWLANSGQGLGSSNMQALGSAVFNVLLIGILCLISGILLLVLGRRKR
ncbi:MAG: hypothetical protein WC641_06165 [Patescibacteria group bacterium]